MKKAMKRRVYLLALVCGVVAMVGIAAVIQQQPDKPEITVYKSPTCGCCAKWVAHLEDNGFEVTTSDMQNVSPMKSHLGVPQALGSCHTAVVEGYVVEGHVPADLIKRLLKEKPDVTGLAVPGMPIGSPGMEGPNPERYDVIAFSKQGSQEVYATR